MKVLITGIHGFVGGNFVNALATKNEIYGLDIVNHEKQGITKTFSWNDLENNVVPDVDTIIHLAGKAHDTKNQTEADQYFEINTGLTKKVFKYFLASNAKKFVFFSSVKAVANAVNEDILIENVEPKPLGPYGESKLKAERYIQDNLPSPETGKSVYILRPCMIHGPGNKGNLNLLYKVVVLGIPWPLGAFQNRRSFTSIDNLCYVINELIEKKIEPGVYNMADDEPVSTNDLIGIICKAMGKKPKIWKISKPMMIKLATIAGALNLPLNPERLRKLTESYVVSNAKIKAALGIERMPVSAQDGLFKTIRSFGK